MHCEAMDDEDEGYEDDGADLIGGCIFPQFVLWERKLHAP